MNKNRLKTQTTIRNATPRQAHVFQLATLTAKTAQNELSDVFEFSKPKCNKKEAEWSSDRPPITDVIDVLVVFG